MLVTAQATQVFTKPPTEEQPGQQYLILAVQPAFLTELFSAEQIDAVANLPTREEALAKFMFVLKAPITKFVRTLVEPHAKLVRTFAALKEKKQQNTMKVLKRAIEYFRVHGNWQTALEGIQTEIDNGKLPAGTGGEALDKRTLSNKVNKYQELRIMIQDYKSKKTWLQPGVQITETSEKSKEIVAK